MAPLKMSNKVARGFRRVSMKFWEVCRSAEVEWSPPRDPRPTPPGSPLGGQQGGFAPNYDGRESESAQETIRRWQRTLTHRQVGG